MSLHPQEQIEYLYLLEQEKREEIVPVLSPLWLPMRYKMVEGGRGSGKSWTFAKIFIIKASKQKIRLLCLREIQDSIDDSVKKLLENTIDLLGYPGWIIQEKMLKNSITGSEIIFKGLKDLRAARNIKSYEDFNYFWIEEAEAVTIDSLMILYPTLRKSNSELWASFNRYDEFDPIYVRWCCGKENNIIKTNNGFEYMQPYPDVMHIKCNWRENPWFPSVLVNDLERDKQEDFDLYLHIWEGQPIAQIENAVIPRILVEQAVQRLKKPEGKKVVGADIARYGGDSITFYLRRGWGIEKRYERKYQDTVTTANALFNFTGQDKYCPYHVDVTGLGGGVADMLRKQKGCVNVIEFNYNSTHVKQKKKYKNIITEMYFDFKELLKEKPISIPDIKNLRQDLTGRKYNYANDEYARKIIEPKDNFKDRYHRSPDDGDALLMCFYEPSNIMKIDPELKAALKQRQDKIRQKNKEAFIL